MTIEICYTVYSPEEFIEALKDKNLAAVSRGAECSQPTITKLSIGDTDKVNLKIQVRVTDYLKGK